MSRKKVLTAKPAAIVRVKELTGELALDQDIIGIRVRYVIGSDRCEVQINYWFRLKVGFKTIRIHHSLDWMDCEEGMAAALELAGKLDIDQLEICDPDLRFSDDKLKKLGQEISVSARS